jgi:o-succinylbenzoate synthase
VLAHGRAALLAVPLREPFVIATATMLATRAVLVELTLDDGSTGIGEGATLPPVTHEDERTVLARINAWLAENVGKRFAGPDLQEALEGLDDAPVTRAALECALLDALARRAQRTVRGLFAQGAQNTEAPMESDITIPILPAAQMLTLAQGWFAKGFRAFKVKVGIDADGDLEAIRSIAQALPGVRFRLDANGGYTAAQALHVVQALQRALVLVECFEQPCDRSDMEGMAKVARESSVPVVADESLRGEDDLARLIQHKAAQGINLKLAKLGGFVRAHEIASRARAQGLTLMIGGMVETRVGMNAAAQLGFALGGCDYADMDTAWLLSEDPFHGGYRDDGPLLHPDGDRGFGVALSPGERSRFFA